MDRSFSLFAQEEYSKVRSLFENWEYHLAPLSVLGCMAPGQVYVDHSAAPTAALVVTGHRYHLVGDANNAGFNQGLRQLLVETLPRQMTGLEDMYMLYYAHPGWEAAIETALKGRDPIQGRRHVYSFQAFNQTWRQSLPSDFEIHRVKPELLQERKLKHVDELEEEMLSEAASLEEFFKNRFGICITHYDEIVSWCLSEYNCGEGCEIGIATVPEYRRQGLATAAASALVEKAHARGLNRVGWHCWSGNQPSVSTALRAGFKLDQEYQVYYGWFNPVTNLAANGNMRFWNAEHQQAVEWYERAFAAGDPPVWAYWNAACANAEAGRSDAAIRCLKTALQRGVVDLDSLLSNEHLKSLRDTVEWQDIVNILGEG